MDSTTFGQAGKNPAPSWCTPQGSGTPKTEAKDNEPTTPSTEAYENGDGGNSGFMAPQGGPDEPKRNSRKGIVLGVIVGVAIIGGAIAGTVLINRSNNDASSATPAPAPVVEQVEPQAEPAIEPEAEEAEEPAPVVEEPESAVERQQLVVTIDEELLNRIAGNGGAGIVRLTNPERNESVTQSLNDSGSVNLSVTVVNDQDEQDQNQMGLQVEFPSSDNRIDVQLVYNPETGQFQLVEDYPGVEIENNTLSVNDLRNEIRSHTQQANELGIDEDRSLTFINRDGATSAEDAEHAMMRWGYVDDLDDVTCIYSENMGGLRALVAHRDTSTVGFYEGTADGAGYFCEVPTIVLSDHKFTPLNELPPDVRMIMAGAMNIKNMPTKTVGTQEACANPVELLGGEPPAAGGPSEPTTPPSASTPPTTPATPSEGQTDEQEEEIVERVEEEEEIIEDGADIDEEIVDDEATSELQTFQITSSGVYSAIECTEQGRQAGAQGIAKRGEGPETSLTEMVQAASEQEAQEILDAKLTDILEGYHADLERQVAEGVACGTRSQALVDPEGREPEQAQPERLDFGEAEATSSVNMEHEDLVPGTQAEPTRAAPAEGEETEQIRSDAIENYSSDNPTDEPRVEKFDSTPPQPTAEIAEESVSFSLDEDGDGERDSDIGVGVQSLRRTGSTE